MSAPGFTDFFETLGRPITYYPALARLLGSMKAAVFLQQLMYWTPLAKDQDGWVYKTAGEWKEETALSYEEQKAVRKILRNRGVMKEQYARLEHRLYFRVDRQALNALWAAEGSVKMPSGNRRKTSFGSEGKPRSVVPDITSEKTAESTSKNPPLSPQRGEGVADLFEAELPEASTSTAPRGVPEPPTSARAAAAALAESFEIFWAKYPKKAARQAALKRWLKLKPDAETLEKILAAIELQVRPGGALSRDKIKQDGDYRPFPSSWLNAGRWTDEVATDGKSEKLKDRSFDLRSQIGSRDSSRPFCAARCGVNFVKGADCLRSPTGFHEDPAESRPQLKHVDER
jgi:hypothetical protein